MPNKYQSVPIFFLCLFHLFSQPSPPLLTSSLCTLLLPQMMTRTSTTPRCLVRWIQMFVTPPTSCGKTLQAWPRNFWTVSRTTHPLSLSSPPHSPVLVKGGHHFSLMLLLLLSFDNSKALFSRCVCLTRQQVFFSLSPVMLWVRSGYCNECL